MNQREEYWYKKFLSMGLDSEEAELMATLKFEIEKDRTILDWLKEEGLSGLKIWAQIHCPTLYNVCSKVWNYIVKLFN